MGGGAASVCSSTYECMCVWVGVTVTAETAPTTHMHATPGSSRGHMRIRLVVLPDAVRGQTEDHLGDHGSTRRETLFALRPPPGILTPTPTPTPLLSSPAGFWRGQKRKHKRTPPAVCPPLRPASASALLLLLLLLPKRASAQRPMNLICRMPPRPARLVTQMRGRRPGCWLPAASHPPTQTHVETLGLDKASPCLTGQGWRLRRATCTCKTCDVASPGVAITCS